MNKKHRQFCSPLFIALALLAACSDSATAPETKTLAMKQGKPRSVSQGTPYSINGAVYTLYDTDGTWARLDANARELTTSENSLIITVNTEELTVLVNEFLGTAQMDDQSVAIDNSSDPCNLELACIEPTSAREPVELTLDSKVSKPKKADLFGYEIVLTETRRKFRSSTNDFTVMSTTPSCTETWLNMRLARDAYRARRISVLGRIKQLARDAAIDGVPSGGPSVGMSTITGAAQLLDYILFNDLSMFNVAFTSVLYNSSCSQFGLPAIPPTMLYINDNIIPMGYYGACVTRTGWVPFKNPDGGSDIYIRADITTCQLYEVK